MVYVSFSLYIEAFWSSLVKILVVGGGTAGLISAMILRQHLEVQVDVVYSDSIGIIGVGEGSTEHFSGFMQFVGIDNHSIIKQCDATYKGGIMFEGWADEPYLHNVSSKFAIKSGQYSSLYGMQISSKNPYLNSGLLWDSRLNKYHLNKPAETPYNQYHFNTYKLNEFLISWAKNMGINFFEDTVTDVILSDDGSIKKVKSNTKTYQYDFYIDCTGFKQLLIGKLGAKWQSFSKYLKMNSAVVFPLEDKDNYNMWTRAKAMNAGWMFQLPVWGRYGNGYIFDNNYITIDEAKKEVEELFGKKIAFGKEFTYDTGCLDKSWIKNCAAIGLSSIFVEPLEASSIGASIQQSFLLMHRLANYTQKSTDAYNKSYTDLTHNIRDFIALHYITKKTNTPFWRDMANMELPESLKNNLELWKDRLPIREDFSSLSDYIMFKEDNFIVVMAGLGLFNSTEIKKEYKLQSQYVQNAAYIRLLDLIKEDDIKDSLTHKEVLNIVREFL